MRRFAKTSLALLATLGTTQAAHADPTLRVQFDQRGDFVMFGNTTGYECKTNGGVTPTVPVVGTVDCSDQSAAQRNDTSADLFWRSDAPGAGEATADNSITVGQARSTAMLSIPAGATVTYARVYWAGRVTTAAGADNAITISRPGAGGLNATVAADDSFTVRRAMNDNQEWYQSTADITDLVTQNGNGAYRVGGIASIDVRNLQNEDPMVGWVAVVIYQLDSDPPRNLAVFDGLDLVNANGSAEVGITGFLVPSAGFDAKLGVIAYEGENSLSGDQLRFNGTALSDAVNPVNNFFNSSRSYLGAPVSVAGDLPQLTGAAHSMAGIDFDVVDVKSQLAPGDQSATIEATSGGDTYILGAFVTSISTFKPDFQTSGKSFVDVNGGSVLPGDVLEYTIVAENTGNDDAVGTVMTDPLPAGLTYVPDSISITSGTNSGAKTDQSGDDQAEYDAASRTIIVRLGTGANASQGGTMAIGASATITFRATVNSGVSGTISNQAIITAEGAQGAPSADYPTDGNGNGTGVPPTETEVEGCDDDNDCGAAAPRCDTSPNPNVCVQCLTDSDCTGAGNTCRADNTCSGGGGGDQDSDGDGLTDAEEIALGSDPNDADSDDDGVPDGEEPNPGDDTDGDGLINVLDPDSDNDGLFDGTEMGKGCSGPGTSTAAKRCRADADMGATKTDPLKWDTDGGGVSDGAEDSNLDGKIDAGEGNPNDPSDDAGIQDSDGDGLSDEQERTLGSDPNDADSDDDGVPDGEEPNPGDDTDGDGLINVLDPDSDNDGLFDGTEMGKGCSGPGTSTAAKRCRADADMGATTTDPLNRDTDGGGVSDGAEDWNLDGKIDAGEGDPNDASDDASIKDSDGDGLSDELEEFIGSDPNDADSDDDGVPDGLEPNPSEDTDGDGLINVLDPDSDNDGLFDGTELGFDCSGKDIDASKKSCIPDADKGATKTSPLNPDSDGGGVPDGVEDANKNGVVDAGETDPNDGSDDRPATGLAGYVLEGGGCSCRTAANGAVGLSPALLAACALLAGLVLRRRSRHGAH